MTIPRVAIFLLSVLLGIAPSCFAQTGQKIPVAIQHSGDDNVGNQLIFELREVIRGSQGMRLVIASEADARVVVWVVTREGTNTPGDATIASITVVFDSSNTPLLGYYVTSSVLLCGSNVTKSCARNVAATVDSAIETIRKSAPYLWNLLK